jgi:hypothetical protein
MIQGVFLSRVMLLKVDANPMGVNEGRGLKLYTPPEMNPAACTG